MGTQILVDEDLIEQTSSLLNQQAQFVETAKKESLEIMRKYSLLQDKTI